MSSIVHDVVEIPDEDAVCIDLTGEEEEDHFEESQGSVYSAYYSMTSPAYSPTSPAYAPSSPVACAPSSSVYAPSNYPSVVAALPPLVLDMVEEDEDEGPAQWSEAHYSKSSPAYSPSSPLSVTYPEYDPPELQLECDEEPEEPVVGKRNRGSRELDALLQDQEDLDRRLHGTKRLRH